MMPPNAETLQSVILSQDLIEKISELRQFVNDPDLGIEIEPLKIYCQKTGHIIGQRDENSLFQLAKIIGKEHIVSNLYHAVSLNVHPAWIGTSPDDLDVLIDNDPVGYACYCFGIITAQFYQNAKNKDPKRQEWIERYWALARANRLLTERGIGELPALNLELCRLLTYSTEQETKHSPKHYLYREIKEFAQTPDMLASLAVTGELTPILTDCINKALARISNYEIAKKFVDKHVQQTRFIDYANTPADAARGPSNIRGQKASRREVKEAGMFAEMAKLFGDSGLNIRQMVNFGQVSTGAWKERIKNEQAAKEAEMMADLIAAGGTNLFGNDEQDDDDNSVEVRKLEITPVMQEIAAQVNQAAKTRIENSNNKLSAIDLIRARKNGEQK